MTTLIGTNPDQIPVNSMLGGMAYQDPDSINVKDFNSSGSSTINTIMCTGLLSGLGQIYLHNGEIQKSNGTGLGLGGQPNLGGPETLQIYGPSSSGLILVTASSFGSLSLDNSALNLTAGSGKELYLCANNTPHIRVTTTGDILNLGTGATKLQVGTTAQRPASPQEGMIRKNSTLGVIEGYSQSQWLSLQAGNLLSVQTFTSSGTYTPTVGTKYIIVEAIGGGGGSGGTAATGSTNVSPSSAGYPGSYVKALSTGITGTYTIAIGSGGSAGAAGGNGGDGGDTSMNGTGCTIIANGGPGGYAGAVITPPCASSRKTGSSYPAVTVGTRINTIYGIAPTDSIALSIYTLLPGFTNLTPLGVRGMGAPGYITTNTGAQAGGAGIGGAIVIYEYS